MHIDRKQFLLMAAGLSQSLSCVVVPPKPAQTPTTQPNATQPGNSNAQTPRSPTDECTNWDAAGQCVEWQTQPASVAAPADECTQWNPRSECIAWGTALPADECTDWNPTGECVGWAGSPVQEGFASPVHEGIASPRDECVGWDARSACNVWETAAPTDECTKWSPTSECVLWLRRR